MGRPVSTRADPVEAQVLLGFSPRNRGRGRGRGFFPLSPCLPPALRLGARAAAWRPGGCGRPGAAPVGGPSPPSGPCTFSTPRFPRPCLDRGVSAGGTVASGGSLHPFGPWTPPGPGARTTRWANDSSSAKRPENGGIRNPLKESDFPGLGPLPLSLPWGVPFPVRPSRRVAPHRRRQDSSLVLFIPSSDLFFSRIPLKKKIVHHVTWSDPTLLTSDFFQTTRRLAYRQEKVVTWSDPGGDVESPRREGDVRAAEVRTDGDQWNGA